MFTKLVASSFKLKPVIRHPVAIQAQPIRFAPQARHFFSAKDGIISERSNLTIH
jgi:hypothetical protein